MKLVIEATTPDCAFGEANVYAKCDACGHKELVAHFTGKDYYANAAAFVECRQEVPR